LVLSNQMAPSGAIFVDESVPWNARQIPLSRPVMALGHQLDVVVGRCSIAETLRQYSVFAGPSDTVFRIRKVAVPKAGISLA
jgi:hypothetical protein